MRTAVNTISLFLLFLCILLPLSLQFSIPINHDAAWYLYAAGEMMDGKQLYRDFIDSNPPLILLLSSIPRLVASTTGISSVLSWICCVGLLATLSVCLCSWIWQKGPFASRSDGILFLAFGVVLCFLPFGTYSFGQREHLFLCLSLPWLITLLPKEGAPISSVARLFIGVLAAVGFCLKPHFALVFFAVEGTRIVQSRSIRPLFSPVHYGIVAGGLFYLVLCLEELLIYFNEVVPQLLGAYGGFDAPFADLIEKPVLLAVCCLAPLLFYRPAATPSHRSPLILLFTAFLGASLGAVWQKKGWEYHYLPARAFALLFLVAFMTACLQSVKGQSRRKARLAFIVCIAMILIQLFPATGRYLNSTVQKELPLPLTLSSIFDQYAPGEYVSVFSFSLYPTFPAVNYSSAKWALHRPSLFLLPGALRGRVLNDEDLYTGEFSDIERTLIERLTLDFQNRPPAVLIVDRSNVANLFGKHDFDFLKYLRGHDGLRKELSNYYRHSRIRSEEFEQGWYDLYLRSGSKPKN